MSRYNIAYNKKRCIELSKSNSSILVYRIPYGCLKDKTHGVEIQNRFVVYILHGKNEKGKDHIYVGKSKNGIDNRPTDHEDKCDFWTDCFVLSSFKEKTFLNDGTIQYIEDDLNRRIMDLPRFQNTTKVTNTGTANSTDEQDCDDYLDQVIPMLDILGLNLFPEEKDEPENDDEETSAVRSDYVRVPEAMLPLYNNLVTKLSELNPDIECVPLRKYIRASIGKRIILCIIPLQSSLKVVFDVKAGDLKDPKNLLEDVTYKGHWGVGNLRYKLVDEKDIPVVIEFANQVINL